MPDEFDDDPFKRLRKTAARSVANSMSSTNALSSVLESVQSNQEALASVADAIPDEEKLPSSSMLNTIEARREAFVAAAESMQSSQQIVERLSEMDLHVVEQGVLADIDPESFEDPYAAPTPILPTEDKQLDPSSLSDQEVLNEAANRGMVTTCPDCGEVQFFPDYDGTPVTDGDKRRCSRCSDAGRGLH